MRKKRVLLDYSGLNDDQLSTLTGRVIDYMDAHAVFTDLPVAVTELEEQLVDFRDKWQKVSPGGSTLGFAEKNDARTLLLASLKDIAFYVKLSNKAMNVLKYVPVGLGIVERVLDKEEDDALNTEGEEGGDADGD